MAARSVGLAYASTDWRDYAPFGSPGQFQRNITMRHGAIIFGQAPCPPRTEGRIPLLFVPGEYPGSGACGTGVRHA